MPQEGRNPEISFGLLTHFPDLEKKGKRGSYGAVVASSLFCCIYLDFLALSLLLLFPPQGSLHPSLYQAGEIQQKRTFLKGMCKIITRIVCSKFQKTKVFSTKKKMI